jgi:hypothetical protein
VENKGGDPIGIICDPPLVYVGVIVSYGLGGEIDRSGPAASNLSELTERNSQKAVELNWVVEVNPLGHFKP